MASSDISLILDSFNYVVSLYGIQLDAVLRMPSGRPQKKRYVWRG